MKRIHVMIVDDMVLIRRMLSQILSEDPEIEVAGTASNGRIALQKITQLQPDVIILDIEMPEMDGLEMLTELRKTHPKLPVIMFSTLTNRGAAVTLDALTLGANDYVTKPSNTGSFEASKEKIREEMIPKIKMFCASLLRDTAEEKIVSPAPVISKKHAAPAANERIDVVTIGVSTGGPDALSVIIPSIPADFPVPILIVQHMPPIFTKLMADRLSEKSELSVHEAEAGGAVRVGDVWIAAGDHHMVVEKTGDGVFIRINQDPPENSCRPAVDPLFRSVARVYGKHVLGVVLTGMGQDGLRGCEHIRDAGGQIYVQDKATSVVWGMPGYVAEAGLAEKPIPLEEIASELDRRVRETSGQLISAKS